MVKKEVRCSESTVGRCSDCLVGVSQGVGGFNLAQLAQHKSLNAS